MKLLHILPDEAHVVRYSQLKEIYEREGSLRLTAQAIGSDTATVQRHLRAAGVDTRAHAITRLKERIHELEEQLGSVPTPKEQLPWSNEKERRDYWRDRMNQVF